jgi:hypothetical protein
MKSVSVVRFVLDSKWSCLKREPKKEKKSGIVSLCMTNVGGFLIDHSYSGLDMVLSCVNIETFSNSKKRLCNITLYLIRACYIVLLCTLSTSLLQLPTIYPVMGLTKYYKYRIVLNFIG